MFTVITIAVFILILGFLVLAHELGHFVTAKIFKAKVYEFGFGYPPRVLGTYKDENGKRRWVGKKFEAENAENTVYSINLIPIGGFVRIKGENENDLAEEDSFGAKKIWQRAVMLGAGVVMNVVLCAVLLSAGFAFGIPSVLDAETEKEVNNIRNEKIQVLSVNSQSPAAEVGIAVGDSLLSIDGKEIKNIEFLNTYTNEHKNKEIEVAYMRGNKKETVKIIPEVLETSNGRAVLGVGVARTGVVSYPWYKSLWYGIKATWEMLVAMFVALAGIIKSIFGDGEMAAQVAGPVGIAVLTGQVVGMGVAYVLQFAALLSLNLAIINILPIPALDGGRLLFILIEKIRGKRINAKIEAWVHTAGYVLLMMLVVVVTYRDIVRWGGQLIDKVF